MELLVGVQTQLLWLYVYIICGLLSITRILRDQVPKTVGLIGGSGYGEFELWRGEFELEDVSAYTSELQMELDTFFGKLLYIVRLDLSLIHI